VPPNQEGTETSCQEGTLGTCSTRQVVPGAVLGISFRWGIPYLQSCDYWLVMLLKVSVIQRLREINLTALVITCCTHPLICWLSTPTYCQDFSSWSNMNGQDFQPLSWNVNLHPSPNLCVKRKSQREPLAWDDWLSAPWDGWGDRGAADLGWEGKQKWWWY
jgi:hypothetical protein